MPPAAPEPLRPLDSELELKERLGNGAMGSVYRARERASGREVALKILHAETASAATRFLREGEVTAGLQHPGIVRVHSIGTLGGRPCLAYELVVGARSFDEAIEAQPELALPLLVQAGQALGAAHALGLTHRDVKSENLLVDKAGRLRVTDFGLVTGEELSRLTQSGAWVGTPMTMAPEQFGARERVGPGTDVWALGVLLYRALTGVYPFQSAESMISLAAAITAGNFERPSRVRPTNAGLEAVCLQAMRPRPEDRHADGGAFAAALEAALEAGEGTSRSGRALASTLGVLCLAGLALGAAYAGSRSDPLASATIPAALSDSPTPSPIQAETPPATPAPPAAPLLALSAWRFDSGPSRLPAALLEEALYPGANTNFLHILAVLENSGGATTQIRAARSLLEGNGVRRDPEAALRILRHTAKGRSRAALVLLIETLAQEGHREEELLWIGRLTSNQPNPFELHRLWRIARDASDLRAPLAKRIWAACDPAHVRWALLDLLEGRRSRRVDDVRAKDAERNEFVVEAAHHGWREDPTPVSDWQLGVILDLLPRELRFRLVRLASPSRRLARLCLRREGQLGEQLRPEDLQVLELALLPTLADAEEEWLVEVLESLLQGRAEPPCLAELLQRLRALSTPAAKRWVAICQARGFGGPPAREGVQLLRELQLAGDHEAGVLLVAGSRTQLRPPILQQLLGLGVQAGHPASMFQLASASLAQLGDQGPEAPRYLALLQRAAEAGDAPAQALVAKRLDALVSKPEHIGLAYSCLKRAADQDHPASLRRLAVFQEAGFGCRADRAAAAQTLRRGALLGDRDSALRLGQLLLSAPEGEGESAAWARRILARRYLRRARLQGAGEAAELALIRHDLADPSRKEAGYRTLLALAKRDPESVLIMTKLGQELLARGQRERGEELLRQRAPAARVALDAYLEHLRAQGRSEEAQAFLDEGVRAEIPHYMIAAAPARYATRPEEAEALLRRAIQLGRPQAAVDLGQLLWDTKQPAARKRAWDLWLRAHRARSVAATRKLGQHEWPSD